MSQESDINMCCRGGDSGPSRARPGEIPRRRTSLRGGLRELTVNGQREVVAALGHRADPRGDGRPRVAFVFAEEDVAVGGAGEERGAAGPEVQHQALDVAVDVSG